MSAVDWGVNWAVAVAVNAVRQGRVLSQWDIPPVGVTVGGVAARLAILGLHMPPSTGIVAHEGIVKPLASILNLFGINIWCHAHKG